MNGVYFILLALFWSLSFLFIKISILSLPPLLCATLRVMIAQIAFTTLFYFSRQNLRLPFSSAWRAWGIGIFMQGIPFALLFWGECFISPALASIINSTVAAWALFFSLFIFRDSSQVTKSKVMGLILGLAGVLCIFVPILIHGGQENRLIGIVAVMGMAISYAIGSLLNQRFCKSKHATPFHAVLWHQHWGSLCFLMMATLIVEHGFDISPVFYNMKLLLALLYLGLFSTACAWMIYHHLISSWGAIAANSVMFFVPVLAILWDRLFFQLLPSPNQLYGVILILSGVALIQFTKKKN